MSDDALLGRIRNLRGLLPDRPRGHREFTVSDTTIPL